MLVSVMLLKAAVSFATSAASHPSPHQQHHILHSPHQQHHIVLAHHCNTSISFHFLLTAFSLLAFFYFQVLKGHDDHVITCLQFCGNRIVSGSDDNTLKVWSAVTGKVSFFFGFFLKDLISYIIIQIVYKLHTIIYMFEYMNFHKLKKIFCGISAVRIFITADDSA